MFFKASKPMISYHLVLTIGITVLVIVSLKCMYPFVQTGADKTI